MVMAVVVEGAEGDTEAAMVVAEAVDISSGLEELAVVEAKEAVVYEITTVVAVHRDSGNSRGCRDEDRFGGGGGNRYSSGSGGGGGGGYSGDGL